MGGDAAPTDAALTRPLRLLVVASGLGTGGAEAMLLKLLPRLADHGIASAVVSLRDRGALGAPLAAGGIPVRALGLPGPAAPFATAGVALWLRRWRPDLIQGWMYHGNLGALFAARAAPASLLPVVFGVRQSLSDLAREKPATRRVIRLGARCSGRAAAIVYNAQLARTQHEGSGYAAQHGVVLGNGFDTELFRPDAGAGARLRDELGIEASARLVGLVARWHPVKDHATFLAAAVLIARAVPATRFVLAGTGIDDANRQLRAVIAPTGLADRLHLLGERHDLARIYPALDVLALSSVAEAFPNVLGEAMSCGVPCATTAVGDAAAIIGDCGRVVPVGDPAALAAAVIDLLSLPAPAHGAMAAAARRRVVERFGIRAIAAQYAALYRRVAAIRAPTRAPWRNP
jgi:glycosyltransferase involved in cell wall biosynthesis